MEIKYICYVYELWGMSHAYWFAWFAFHDQQDDEALREVAADLGIEIQLVKRKRNCSLGQAYPIMDDSQWDDRPVATPQSSELAPPNAVAPPAEPVAPEHAVAGEPAAPTHVAAEGASAEKPVLPEPAPAEAEVAGGEGGRQTMLEELAACQFKPYANQPVIRPRMVQRLLRQTLLTEFEGFQVCKPFSKDFHGVFEHDIEGDLTRAFDEASGSQTLFTFLGQWSAVAVRAHMQTYTKCNFNHSNTYH